MRWSFISIVLLLFAFELSWPALAGSAPKAVPEPRGAQSLSIVEDHDAKAFRFLIDGKEVARLDADGLHVREGIEYGATLTDTGSTYYDEHATAREGAR